MLVVSCSVCAGKMEIGHNYHHWLAFWFVLVVWLMLAVAIWLYIVAQAVGYFNQMVAEGQILFSTHMAHLGLLAMHTCLP